jgi:hypothetical protein
MKPDMGLKGCTYTPITTGTATAPVIVFSKKAIKWIAALVDIHPVEVGWYGVVDKREDGSYFVRDVLYPKHSEMEAATCEISPEGEAEMIELLMNEDREEDIPKAKKLWGHSHHNMTTHPSGQDEKMAMEIMESSQDFLIRAICIKKGEMSLSFYDYERKLRFDHVGFTVETDETDEDIVSRLNSIRTIMDNDGETSTLKKKFSEIKNLVMHDGETKQIRKWVRELKVVNTPVPTKIVTTTYPSNSNGPHTAGFTRNSKKNEVQESLFNHISPGKNHLDESDFEPSHSPRGPLEREVDDVMEDFDRRRGVGAFD